jgi:hypothetical protein
MVHRRRRVALILALATGLVGLPVSAGAQGPPRPSLAELRALFGMPVPAAGFRGGYDLAVDAWSVGAQGVVPLGEVRRILAMPSADLFLRRHRADWQINADVAAGVGPLRLFHAGAGLALLNREPEPGAGGATRAGVNLFGGVEFPGVRTATRPFLQLRLTVGEGGPLHIVGGFNYRFTDG